MKRLAEPFGEECVEWPFANVSGYGIFGTNDGQRFHVTHVAYETHNGTIPEGMFVLHRCDNPPCFNPRHLFVGTTQDNMDDKATKGRLLLGTRHQNSKLTDEIVKQIRELQAAGLSCGVIGRRLGLDYKHVWKVTVGQLWSHVR